MKNFFYIEEILFLRNFGAILAKQLNIGPIMPKFNQYIASLIQYYFITKVKPLSTVSFNVYL